MSLNIRYENLSYDELYSEAERNNNTVALALDSKLREFVDEEAEIKYSEQYQEDEGNIISRTDIADACVYIFTEAEWVESEDNDDEWYLDDIHRDENDERNHVGIKKLESGHYKIFVEYGVGGGELKEEVVESLEAAFYRGKITAARIAGTSLLFI